METERYPRDWRAKRTPMRHTRRARNWVKLTRGERIETKAGEVTDWLLLDGPWTKHPGRGAMSYVEVRCVGCGSVYERRLDKIVGGGSRRCRSCAARARRKKAKPTAG